MAGSINPTVVFEELTDTYGRVSVEPLEVGFGVTLGNSLRRVLLSSIKGAAVVGLRIDGVLHEFSVIDGVVEDVINIILNIKQLYVSVFTDDLVVLKLQAKGPKEITAADIEPNAVVEIKNPDLHIATLEEDGELNMEIYVKTGYGYLPWDRERPADYPVDVILIDAAFSPIRKVSYKVSDTRVGRVTNYDKLTLEVWTNGSIKPDDAISEAANVLIEHFGLFINKQFDRENVKKPEIRYSTDEESIKLERLNMSIRELDLSVRAENCLLRAGIETVKDLLKKKKEELLKIRNFGKKSLSEVEKKVEKLGFKLGENA
ncbi:MAG: DNA-directed RNA polymerase subunit alpha [Synergistetes bacterium]|nr:DNA-directed RNA polymerase subunit alpha [Synergistota bacterium]